jgi:hypothetical protein
MSLVTLSIEDAPFGAFHRRLAIYSCGAPFCDGHILGIIAIALSPLSKEIRLTPGWQGLIAAASLVRMFIGGSFFGFLTTDPRISFRYSRHLSKSAAIARFAWITYLVLR